MTDPREYTNQDRREYSLRQLDDSNLPEEPFGLFEEWLADAVSAAVPLANAAVLCTATKDGKPSSRVVLVRDYHESGFVFYTSYNSRKSKEIAENPYGAIHFFWVGLERQVKLEGTIIKNSGQDSDEYFKTRPKGSQIGAHVSPQSEVIPNRQFLEERFEALKTQYGDEPIPRPADWGGFILKPTTVEFWQGRENRLHDRFLYSLQENGAWKLQRLAP